MSQIRNRSTRLQANAGDALLVRALFQIDPSWYQDYWYGPVRPAAPAPIRRCFATLALFATKIARLQRLIAERPKNRAPLPELHEAH